MLTESASWTGDDVGVFSALLIALAGGWAASRMVRVHPDPFGCLVLGVTGAVAGAMAAGALGLKLGPIGLLAASIAGGAAVFMLGRVVSNVTEWRRNRNHVDAREFESSGPRTQEDTYELDYRHHHRHRRGVDRREDHAPQPWSAHQPDRRPDWRPHW